MKIRIDPCWEHPQLPPLYSCFLCLTSRRLKDKRIERWKVLTTFVRALNPRRQPNKYPTRNARTVSNRQQPIKERKSSFMCDYVFFKLHDLSSIVSCVPIEILFKKSSRVHVHDGISSKCPLAVLLCIQLWIDGPGEPRG